MGHEQTCLSAMRPNKPLQRSPSAPAAERQSVSRSLHPGRWKQANLGRQSCASS